MNETLSLALALAMGASLGAIFFGGLWWTIRSGFRSKRPGLWFFVSLLLRTSLTLAGFYVVARGHWENLLACLVGFVMARVIVMRFTHVTETSSYRIREAGDAPYSR